jgi:LuxR family maltose regulon positive regulatory protein
VEHDVGLFRVAGHHAVALARALHRRAPSPFLRAVVERPDSPAVVRPAKELIEQLTEREATVLTLLPTRLSNIEIAEQLGVSLNTVKTHLKHIYRKLAVTGRTEAVDEAERMRLL